MIEFTALVAARELECKYEWAAHVVMAKKPVFPRQQFARFMKKEHRKFLFGRRADR